MRSLIYAGDRKGWNGWTVAQCLIQRRLLPMVAQPGGSPLQRWKALVRGVREKSVGFEEATVLSASYVSNRSRIPYRRARKPDSSSHRVLSLGTIIYGDTRTGTGFSSL